MSENEIFPVPENTAKAAFIDNEKYIELYQQSIEDPECFWKEQGQRINWIKPYEKIKDVSFLQNDVHIKWYYDGTLNAAANCIDRHLSKRGDQVAIIWEGDDPTDHKSITYRELHKQVCKFAN